MADRRRAAIVVLAATGLLAITCQAQAQASESEAERIQRFEQSLRPAISVEGQPETRWTLQERMAHWNVPGLGIAVIRDGKLAWARGYGVLQAGGREPVDTDTVFSVGSVSKMGAAATSLRLVDAGVLALDRDVNADLKRWQVPVTPATLARPVTLRGILSHTAGLSVHGFGDFLPGAALPTGLDTLAGRPPARNEPVRVVHLPGERFQYSGGGTTVEQVLVEDVTGLGFPEAARRHLFQPLGMGRSTYVNPVPPAHGNIAKAHGPDGKPRALPRGYEAMPEMAASGLWTTPSDFARLVIALIESYRGAPGAFLSPALAHDMMQEVGPSMFGLGPFLAGQGMERRFYHSGSNDSYKAWSEGHLATGDGVVIFTNGEQGSALYPEVRRAVALVEGWADALDGHVRVPEVRIPAEELAARAGVYRAQVSDAPFALRRWNRVELYRVLHAHGALYLARADGRPGPRLVPQDPTHFLLEETSSVHDTATVFEFVRDHAGHTTGLVVREGTQGVVEARRVDAD